MVCRKAGVVTKLHRLEGPELRPGVAQSACGRKGDGLQRQGLDCEKEKKFRQNLERKWCVCICSCVCVCVCVCDCVCVCVCVIVFVCVCVRGLQSSWCRHVRVCPCLSLPLPLSLSLSLFLSLSLSLSVCVCVSEDCKAAVRDL
jgi:hypothetical protein